jgi:asparagine synthase (glutamine-hydrolysing)
LPQELFERPKRGFGVPIATWLRGPLRDWAESLLDERRLLNQGILEPAAVRSIWRRHQTDWCDCPELVWNLLMFQAWLDSPGAVGQIAH